IPPYLASRCDLNTWTLLRAMTARRTRRISSSLLPLNITPATTSIHPPLWWNGPLGPLTDGRDLYEVSPPLREVVCLVARRVRVDDRAPPSDLANGPRPQDAAAPPPVDLPPPAVAALSPARAGVKQPRRARFRRTPAGVFRGR